MHEYHLENSFKESKIIKQKKIKFKNLIEKSEKDEIWETAEKLYEKGYSGLDLVEYIKDLKIDEGKKYEYLVFIQKVKKEFRDEKLLMMCILNFLLIRSDYHLENISFM